MDEDKQTTEVENQIVAKPSEKTEDGPKRLGKKVCFFCDQQKSPDYTDASNLRRFLNDRARIVAKMRTGVCAKHQRRLAKEIKYARHLALLPFVVKV